MSVELETTVAIMQNDLGRVSLFLEKTETTIDKLTEVSNSLARMLAVHEEKLSIHEHQFTQVEKRKSETQVDIKELHSRITTTTRELSEEISQTETRISQALKEGLEEIKTMITDEHTAMNVKNKEIEKRVADLEKWRWLIVGGSIVIGFLSSYVIAPLITK